MKNKFIKTLMLVSASAMLIGCSESTPTDDQVPESTEGTVEPATTDEVVEEIPVEETPETESPTEINFESDTGRLVYTGHELTTDYEGNPALLVHFDFTNLSDENSNAMFQFDISPFQNGIECNLAILSEVPDTYNNSITDIKKDITLPVSFAYELSDTASPVILEVNELFGSDDPQSQELILQ